MTNLLSYNFYNKTVLNFFLSLNKTCFKIKVTTFVKSLYNLFNAGFFLNLISSELGYLDLFFLVTINYELYKY